MKLKALTITIYCGIITESIQYSVISCSKEGEGGEEVFLEIAARRSKE